ncbi:MAG: 2-oxoglutarate dehydrogenase complex dihydrolipoyllysine-residue succinyltransferase [Alphaproteobacteria bacterium]|jgi:2-oxoglutarate dehydrogenase E2 component (dihydrolipoamide succinyltransferase)|nr:2-oxoglutarate dehydrogenase complex dihydrolipoyllysine-residue succinyltransferase [Alphaproteobacteria bacterium]MBT4085388.1 2-oxoglutarate dehydrogenase complex dihydrolipoyllysine-residue succinyltransferase [Alphaproteobacteria bacterium]MBT4544534.1 2-oxoglutarate dehydrogenase complex dihydrolipoyllysine-residue succinyltransferase [Alphaproteobacteria bacterium]MBT7744087.1 2-oxoglutarate dehydrogenase complex dihydrolipoyllysine-residue succinyltransferase [Alphaproteobacteria bact
MTTEIRVPVLGESITEATIGKWFKAVGEAITEGEPIVELETDKVTLEVPAPAGGALVEISAAEGDTIDVGGLLGTINEGAAGAAAKTSPTPVEVAAPVVAPASAPAVQAPATSGGMPLSPAVEKLVKENNLDASQITGTGKDGRLVKGDVLAFLSSGGAAAPVAAAPAAPSGPRPKSEREERVRMTRLRKRIAERLKEAQNTAAMLTTFNEVDMTAVMAARATYRDAFEKKHGVRLGFMSFFVKACVLALQELPAVNAEIEGDDIVYKDYYDIGVAVGTPNGLVVPVLRDADELGFADVEKNISELGRKARDGKLTLEEMNGGTFTITNGGVYGSLMSTPILNPPQSGILGMHKIQQRPMAVGNNIELRPMMYLAMSYDHRIVDGREAVTFLVRVKECLEDPQRIMLDL